VSDRARLQKGWEPWKSKRHDSIASSSSESVHVSQGNGIDSEQQEKIMFSRDNVTDKRPRALLRVISGLQPKRASSTFST
jgi:hypothetical protein